MEISECVCHKGNEEGEEAAVDESSREGNWVALMTHQRPMASRQRADYIIPLEVENRGNEYVSPGSEKLCRPGVKIPEMSL